MKRSHPFDADEAALLRFGRVLTGSDAVAAVFARDAHDAMTANPEWFEPAPSARVALIKTLMGIWSDGWVGSTGDARRAFLLAAMEGLPPERIGPALGYSEALAEELIERAVVELRDRLARDVLVVSSDSGRGRLIVEALRRLGHRALGPVQSLQEASALAANTPPGFVIADMRLILPSLVKKISQQYAVPVILLGSDSCASLLGSSGVPVFCAGDPIDADHLMAAIWLAVLSGHVQQTQQVAQSAAPA